MLNARIRPQFPTPTMYALQASSISKMNIPPTQFSQHPLLLILRALDTTSSSMELLTVQRSNGIRPVHWLHKDLTEVLGTELYDAEASETRWDPPFVSHLSHKIVIPQSLTC